MTRGLAPPDTLVDGASAKNRPAAAPRDASSGVGDPPDISEFLGAVRLRGPSCTIATIREALPEQRVAALDAAMAMDNRSMPHTVISEVVTKWLGVSPVGSLTRVGSDIVNRHRNGRCACRKD